MKRNWNFKIVSTLSALVVSTTLSFGLGFNCSRMKPSGSSDANSFIAPPEEPAIGVAFLSSEQMVKSMISATGTEGFGELTDPADDLIDRTYSEKSGMLPSLTNLHQATGPTMIAVTNLASTVCAKAVDRDRAIGEAQASDRLFFRELNFLNGLAAQNSDGVTRAFERIARNAWRRDVASTDLDTVVTMAQEFSAGVSGTDPEQTRLLAISVCTVALSSVDALTY